MWHTCPYIGVSYHIFELLPSNSLYHPGPSKLFPEICPLQPRRPLQPRFTVPHPNYFMPKQCTIHAAIIWYHFGLAQCLISPDICENHKLHTNIYTYTPNTYIQTYMTRAHFLSFVGLRLRAFVAQPPSVLCCVFYPNKMFMYVCYYVYICLYAYIYMCRYA